MGHPLVTAIILHPPASPAAGPLERAVEMARRDLAARHRVGFLAAGAGRAEVLSDGSDGRVFGARLRALAATLGPDDGLVVLGSGAIPLATRADRRRFVAAAASDSPGALANNRYSADVVAIARARDTLAGLPELDTDNALPRWLEDVRGIPVHDLRDRWRLGVDIDGPLDLVLLGGRWVRHLPVEDAALVDDRLARIRGVAGDRRAELLISGRTSAAGLGWLERTTSARVRAIVEERGMRTAPPGQRPPASVLGRLLERDGPDALGARLAELADAALVDSRVLLADRCGRDPAAWPSTEDRAASDLLLHHRIADPWLRALTRSAAGASIAVVLGGHTLVGPGLRLAFRPGAGRP